MAGVLITRSGRTIRVTVVAALAAVLVLGTAVWQLWGGTVFGYEYSCSRSGQRNLQQSQEEFVRTHFSDATGVDVKTYDCDSGGPAVLVFSTKRAPAAARDTLLVDTGCEIRNPEPSSENVECQSGSDSVWISLSATDDGTAGELTVD
jgi:hypothetical protein